MKTCLTVPLLFVLSSLGLGSVLSDAARLMKPGDWRALMTVDMVPVFTNTGGSSNMINAFAETLRWDPVSRRAYFLGSDHGGDFNESYRFVCYDESTNAWIRLPQPPWSISPPGSYYDAHGYDQTAIDPDHRILYRRPYNSNTIRTYQMDSGTWGAAPAGPQANSCCDAIEYFPDLGGLVWNRGNGTVDFLNQATGQWSSLASGTGLNSTWMIAEYSAARKTLILSSSTRGLYKVTGGSQVTRQKDLAVSVYDGSAWNGVITSDPVSGDFLAFTATARQMHVYDVAADSWKLAARQPPPQSLTGGSLNAAPIETYGVTLFAHCKSGCQTILYKHSAAAAAEGKGTTQTGTWPLDVRPNPAHGSVALRLLTGTDGRVRFGIFSASGQIVKSIGADAGGGATADVSRLPAGVYFVKGSSDNRAFSKKLLVSR